MSILVTRLHGHRAVFGLVSTTNGPTCWVGEFRSNTDRPYEIREGNLMSSPPISEVRMAFDLGSLLVALEHRALSIRDLPTGTVRQRRRDRRRARITAQQGQLEGTRAVNEALNRR